MAAARSRIKRTTRRNPTHPAPCSLAVPDVEAACERFERCVAVPTNPHPTPQGRSPARLRPALWPPQHPTPRSLTCVRRGGQPCRLYGPAAASSCRGPAVNALNCLHHLNTC
jgi:hypothetical protein